MPHTCCKCKLGDAIKSFHWLRQEFGWLLITSYVRLSSWFRFPVTWLNNILFLSDILVKLMIFKNIGIKVLEAFLILLGAWIGALDILPKVRSILRHKVENVIASSHITISSAIRLLLLATWKSVFLRLGLGIYVNFLRHKWIIIFIISLSLLLPWGLVAGGLPFLRIRF